MLRETETDRAADSGQSVGPEHQQESDIVDMWVRGSSDNLLMKGLDGMMGLLTHAASEYTRDVEKQLKVLKKFS